ncbi:hypothetical protein G7046_g4293 [Stylonectria norvegica]|nr:hypothetical protein G7046_g4293 [Stylonectria norvegica]
MEVGAHSDNYSEKPRAKVKTGCRTCKIRKVKCDEGRPACRRCITTGRICDGYGIWGGGGNHYGIQLRQRYPQDLRVISRPPVSISVPVSGAEELRYFEWFQRRTATKLPGSYVSGFWDTLIFQASFSEPAVLHAVLALASVHKSNIVNADEGRTSDSFLNAERFTLQHYVKAISHLHPHFTVRDKASIRVALITCVVFICLELLRGHIATAQGHLENGLDILAETHMFPSEDDGVGELCPKTHYITADNWIAEIFTRLHLQFELFRYNYEHSRRIIEVAGSDTMPPAFETISDVWSELGRQLNKIFDLSHQRRQQLISTDKPPQIPPILLARQEIIRTELERWPDMHEALQRSLKGHSLIEEQKGHRLLSAFHMMTIIMAETCLDVSDEMAYDMYSEHFVKLLTYLASLRKSEWGSLPRPIPVLSNLTMDMSRSIIDLGWIFPLYYTATKCRVHRVRHQAVRLLASTTHREGMWDSRTVACVARKVVEMEERDFYGDLDKADDFPLLSPPSAKDLMTESLPESYRIREVEVVLAGAPMDHILLFCKKLRNGIDCRVLLSEYDVPSQRWVDP